MVDTIPAGELELFSYVNGAFAAATSDAGTADYSYIIPGKAGDDTTLASGKATLWLQSGEYATDVYEVIAPSDDGFSQTPLAYTVGSALRSSANSKLTSGGDPGQIVGFVTKAPSAGNPFLHFYKV